jgi:alpha-1,3/alpha-1,6-mannosyltransferase
MKRFHVLLATLRQLHLVLTVSVFTNELRALQPDAFIVDQLSACVPLLRCMWPEKQRILFYCHFPDQLLAQRHEGGLLGLAKRAYRLPFDWFEGWSMSASDRIVVNSAFTRSVVNSLFKGLGDLRVVYPCVDTEAAEGGKEDGQEAPPWGGIKVLLSINRFERKKDVGLAIRAYRGLTPRERKNSRLVLAGELRSFVSSTKLAANWHIHIGGYDQRVSENVDYHKELEHLADSMGLSHATAKAIPTALAIPSSIEILFLLSVPGAFKSTLLRNAKLLVYTPANEHFGIVPVEAMHQGVPVLAANTGGPLETVVENQTGWLRDVRDVDEWTNVMRSVLVELRPSDMEKLGRNGKERVSAEFSRTTMARRFENVLAEMADSMRKPFVEWWDILLAVAICGAFSFFLAVAMIKPNIQRIVELKREL